MVCVPEALPNLAGPAVPFRLGTESGAPESSSDRTAQSTLYFTPAGIGYPWLPLFDGTTLQRWLQLTQLSLALSGLTSGKNYDAIVYRNGTTNYLDLMPAWTNDTTRASAIAIHASTGLWSNSGSITSVINGHTVAAGKGLHVGTIRTTGTTTTEDSAAKRFVWNRFNQVNKSLKKAVASSHSYDGGYRQWNNDTANKVEFVLGEAQKIGCNIFGEQNTGAANRYAIVGQAMDSTSVYDSIAHVFDAGAGNSASIGAASGYSASAGYHYIAALQSTVSLGAGTFIQFALNGMLRG
jgi:hypothetical protein